MNESKKVAIIIVTWKGMQWIKGCLDSIRCSNFPVTVFAIDNNSPDETPRFIEQNYPEVKLTHSKENLGFGKANNIGIKQAMDEGFDFFFLLNQDAYIKPDTINQLLAITENEEYAIISPMHFNGNGTAVDFYFRDYVLGKCADYLDDVTIGNKIKPAYESDFIPAAGWLLPRKTVNEIGGFDPLFYHYGEDDNYCSRVRFHQRKIVFATQAVMLHDRTDTVGNKKVYNKNIHFRKLLIDCMDQTKSTGFIIQKTGRQFYDDIGLWLMYVLTGKWKKTHNFLWDYCKLLSKFGQIRKDRIANSKLQTNWL